MKHRIDKSSSVSAGRIVYHLELIPENEKEIQLIKAVENMTSSEEENSFINNYLIQFVLKEGHSPLSTNSLKNEKFELICQKNK